VARSSLWRWGASDYERDRAPEAALSRRSVRQPRPNERSLLEYGGSGMGSHLEKGSNSNFATNNWRKLAVRRAKQGARKIYWRSLMSRRTVSRQRGNVAREAVDKRDPLVSLSGPRTPESKRVCVYKASALPRRRTIFWPCSNSWSRALLFSHDPPISCCGRYFSSGKVVLDFRISRYDTIN